MNPENGHQDDPVFKLLFEASPHPYLILRPDAVFTIAAVNDRYLAATGTRREAIVGHGLFEIFPDNPDDHSGSGVSDLHISLNRVLSDRRQDIMGVQKYDIPLRDGSGGFEVKYWSPVNTPVFGPDDAIAFIIHHVEDVTDFILNREHASRENPERIGKVEARVEGIVQDRRSAAARLRERDIRFETTFEQAAVGIAHVALDGRWLRVNRKLCEIVGYNREELLVLTFQDITYPDDLDIDLAHKCQIEAGEIDTYSMEKRYLRKDRSLVWINLTVALAWKADGAPDYFISFIEDIQRRKQVEDEIHRLNAELEQRVEARTAELTAANQELESFAYAVSHDLRAPLRAMSGFSQALLEDYGERLDNQARVYLDQISLASHRMSELIDGILTLSRSTRGELRRDPVDLAALAERLLAERAAAEPERRVAWRVEPELRAQGDPVMLEVVMCNLIENAWKYTAKTPNATIRVYTEDKEGERCFCVADNGAGFDMSHANRLFHAFQRLHRQDEFPGIGIGLATVQHIVHRHGGTIRAEGAPGRGATFRFTLPYAETLREETAWKTRPSFLSRTTPRTRC